MKTFSFSAFFFLQEKTVTGVTKLKKNALGRVKALSYERIYTTHEYKTKYFYIHK